MTHEFDNRFTERARKVLVLAQEEARRMQHKYIGTEHLLVGLVKQETDVAARVLRDFGVEITQVRERIEQTVGRGRRTPLGQRTGLTPRTKSVIELAVEEARRMGHQWIGTEHLLLGLIQEGEGLAVAVLRDLGVDLDAVRTWIIQMMPGAARQHRSVPGVAGCYRCTGTSVLSVVPLPQADVLNVSSLCREERVSSFALTVAIRCDMTGQ